MYFVLKFRGNSFKCNKIFMHPEKVHVNIYKLKIIVTKTGDYSQPKLSMEKDEQLFYIKTKFFHCC